MPKHVALLLTSITTTVTRKPKDNKSIEFQQVLTLELKPDLLHRAPLQIKCNNKTVMNTHIKYNFPT